MTQSDVDDARQTSTDLSTDPDAARSDAADRRPGRDRRRLLLLSAAVVSVLLLVAAVVLGLQVRSRHEDQQARRDAAQAAEQQAVNVTSLSSKDVEGGLAKVVAGATGDFKTEYDQQADRLREALTTQEITATGEVVDSAVVRADRENAVVLVVVDGTVANKAQPAPQPRRYRMQLEMDHVGDRWLTSALQILD